MKRRIGLLGCGTLGRTFLELLRSKLSDQYEAAGIFDKMRKGTFKSEDMKTVAITNEDLNNALKEVREKESLKSNGRIVIKGFRQT